MNMGRLTKAKHHNLAETLLGLQDKVEVVIIDSGPGFSEELLSTIKVADHVIVVTNPEIHAVTDALKTINIVQQNGIPVLGAILNKHVDDKYHMTPHNVETLLEKPIIGIIPHDDAIRRSHYYKHPVTYSHPLTHSSIAFKKIAAELIGEKYQVYLDKNKKKPFFSTVLSRLGLKVDASLKEGMKQ
jgi:MinD-like ATPase involved in chromosome partitioning or flagellar assembly